MYLIRGSGPLLAGTLLLLVLVRPQRALADEGSRRSARPTPTHVDVRYEAPVACPSVEELLARVQQRLARDWEPALAEFATRLQVEVVRNGERYFGTVEFVNGEGERFSRKVSGRDCTEVIDALSLMTALATKVHDEQSAAAPSATTEQPDGVGTSSTTAVTPVPPLAAGEPPPGMAEVPLSPRKQTSSAHPVRSPSMNAHVRFGGRASVTSGVGPGLALGPGAFVTLELARARAGLAVDVFDSGDVRASGVPASFRLLALRMEGCPWSLALNGWSRFEPCATGEFGSFRAAARVEAPEVTASDPKSVSWGALGLLSRLVLHARPFVAQIELIGRATLRQEGFYIREPSQRQVVFRIPAVSGGLSAGLGLEF